MAYCAWYKPGNIISNDSKLPEAYLSSVALYRSVFITISLKNKVIRWQPIKLLLSNYILQFHIKMLDSKIWFVSNQLAMKIRQKLLSKSYSFWVWSLFIQLLFSEPRHVYDVISSLIRISLYVLRISTFTVWTTFLKSMACDALCFFEWFISLRVTRGSHVYRTFDLCQRLDLLTITNTASCKYHSLSLCMYTLHVRLVYLSNIRKLITDLGSKLELSINTRLSLCCDMSLHWLSF